MLPPSAISSMSKSRLFRRCASDSSARRAVSSVLIFRHCGSAATDSPTLTARMATERIPITVCPTSNVVIAHCFERLEDHVLPQMRAAGLLATVNTDDPAMSDLDLGKEYAAVARAFGWSFDEMVRVALDGIAACWLDESEKSDLRRQVAIYISTRAAAASG